MIFSYSNFFKNLKLRILYFGILMLGGFWVSPLWSVFLMVWLGISLFWSYTKKIEFLSVFEKQFYHYSLYFYPIVGTLIKVYIFIDLFPNTYFWVNRFEHSLWAMVLTILLLPAWKGLRIGLEANEILGFTTVDKSRNHRIAVLGSSTVLFIIILGIICFFGNMVEFVEYGFRVLGRYQYKYAVYYPDTIFDMMSNIVGASLGFVAVMASHSKDPE